MTNEVFTELADLPKLQEFLKREDISDIIKLDRIDYFTLNVTASYPHLGYKGKLPPMNAGCSWFCDKYSVEVAATLYKNQPDLFAYSWDESYGVCTALNRHLMDGTYRHKNCVSYKEYKTECTDPNYNGRPYYMGDYQIDKRYGKAVYDYWLHLVSKGFNIYEEQGKVREHFNELLNRKYYCDKVLKEWERNNGKEKHRQDVL